MVSCKRMSEDKLMKALVAQGINLILPPRADVDAGALILADPDNSIRIGSWQPVFGLKLAPTSKVDTGFRAFTFEASSTLNSEASSSVFGSILQKFGLASGGFKGAFDKSNAAMIEFTLIAPANRSLTNFDEMLAEMNEAKAEPAATYQEKRFFVVTKVWRARGLRLRVLDKTGKQIDLNAQAVEELQASAKLSIKKEDQGSYAFTAAEAQVFGLTMRELIPLKDASGAIVIGERPSDEHKTFRSGDGTRSPDFVGDDDAFVSFLE